MKTHFEATHAADPYSRTMQLQAGRPSPGFTLSDLLNVLDGTQETPGRMLIMTTSHPEALDPALTRPGRADVRMVLGRMDAYSLGRLLDAYCDDGMSASEAALAPAADSFTPAEAGRLVMEASCKREAALAALLKEAP